MGANPKYILDDTDSDTLGDKSKPSFCASHPLQSPKSVVCVAFRSSTATSWTGQVPSPSSNSAVTSSQRFSANQDFCSMFGVEAGQLAKGSGPPPRSCPPLQPRPAGLGGLKAAPAPLLLRSSPPLRHRPRRRSAPRFVPPSAPSARRRPPHRALRPRRQRRRRRRRGAWTG